MPILWIFRLSACACVCVLDIRDAQNCAANSVLFFLVLHIHNHLYGIYRNYDISFFSFDFAIFFIFFTLFFMLVMAQSACRILIRFVFSSVYCVTSGSGFVCLWINIWIEAHFHFSLYVCFCLFYFAQQCVRLPYRKHLWICVALNRVELTVQTHRDFSCTFSVSVCRYFGSTHSHTHAYRDTHLHRKNATNQQINHHESDLNVGNGAKIIIGNFESCWVAIVCLLAGSLGQYSISTCNNIEAILLFLRFFHNFKIWQQWRNTANKIYN